MAAGSGVATLGIAGSPGVPEELAALTTVVPYNDVAALEAAFQRFPGEIAAVFLEPVAANMGLVPPEDGYLAAVRRLTAENGALLVFDEVISGFRVAAGRRTGALRRLGRISRRSARSSAADCRSAPTAGRRDLMERMAPVGPVYQAGTLSGNPLAMSAGIAMLDEIARRPPYARLEKKGALLERCSVARSRSAASPTACC